MNGNIEYDTAESGLRAVLKDHQELALRAIWATPEGLGSKAVWDRVNAELKPNTISRASVINFLESMREIGALKGVEKTGKGRTPLDLQPSHERVRVQGIRRLDHNQQPEEGLSGGNDGCNKQDNELIEAIGSS